MNKMTNDIPAGHTKEDIKAREKLIKDFYAQWIAEHPEKKIWNRSLGAYINVKFLSINETYEKASRSYESTLAVYRLSEILEGAIKTPSPNKPNKQQSHHSWSDGSLCLGLETTFAGHKGCHPFSEFPL